MKSFVALIVTFLALALTPIAASGPSNDNLSFYLYAQRVFSPVDHQTWCGDCVGQDWTTQTPWAINPGTFWPYDDLAVAFVPPATHYSAGEKGCLWDSDDEFQYLSQGNVLAPGASVTLKTCRYANTNNYGLYEFLFNSPSPDLSLTITWTAYTGTTQTYTATPTFDASTHSWKYFDCLYSPRFFTEPEEPIPGSNGSAVPERVNFTLSNPTRQKVARTGGQFDAGNQDGIPLGCVNSGWHFP